MTCIVGLVGGDGSIYVGGDSAGVEGYDIVARADKKVFHPGGEKSILIGFCGSFRARDLLEYGWTVPAIDEKMDPREYMVKRFIPKCRSIFKCGGHTEIKDNAEVTETSFIVGFNRRLFTVDVDFQVGEHIVPYAAVGCGGWIAMGSMYTSSFHDDEAECRVLRSLESAEAYSAGVRGPHYCMSIGPRTRFKRNA